MQVTDEADGYQPYLTSPENGLRQLIKRCLDLAKQPGLQCVDEVGRTDLPPKLWVFLGLKSGTNPKIILETPTRDRKKDNGFNQ